MKYNGGSSRTKCGQGSVVDRGEPEQDDGHGQGVVPIVAGAATLHVANGPCDDDAQRRDENADADTEEDLRAAHSASVAR